jgi:alpha-L-fucosidase 2
MTRHLLTIDNPPLKSDHGLPIANGLLGATIWLKDDSLALSLDRTDLWDLRPIAEYDGQGYSYADTIAMHRAGRHAELAERLEKPYTYPGPTKLPAGRIRVAGLPWQSGVVDLHSATAKVNGDLEVFISAHDECGHMRWSGATPRFSLEAPAFGGKPEDQEEPAGISMSHADVWDLGYAAPSRDDGPQLQAFVQEGYGGYRFAIVLAWEGKHAAWSIATSDDGPDPLAVAKGRVAAALSTGYDAAHAAHRLRWKAMWCRSSVSLPDSQIERHYYFDMYKLLAAARRGAPPIALQGPWTSDNGRLPPWKGDYHHDLNTQLTYWPAYKGNQLDIESGFLDWLWDTMPECMDWTRRYFDMPGLNVPMTADLKNRQIGGWMQYTHMASTSAWLAHHFDLHWRYSGDETFLAERAYPYLAATCTFIDAVTAERDANGKRTLTLSSSPEVNDNRPEAWFDTMTAYDNSLFFYALHAAAGMADRLGKIDEAAHWRQVASELPPIAADESGLLVAAGTPPDEKHRHFSHMLAIHPLELQHPNIDASARQRSIDWLRDASPDYWMGYSFAWAAAIHAIGRDGDSALKNLRIYIDHCFPNSFHGNGDWQAKGHTKAVFGAFTLEGNSAAAAAVQEMLLHSAPGAYRLFPALPSDWQEAAFTGFLGDGGVTISASLKAGEVYEVALLSPRETSVTLSGPGLPERKIFLKPHSVWQLETL